MAPDIVCLVCGKTVVYDPAKSAYRADGDRANLTAFDDPDQVGLVCRSSRNKGDEPHRVDQITAELDKACARLSAKATSLASQTSLSGVIEREAVNEALLFFRQLREQYLTDPARFPGVALAETAGLVRRLASPSGGPADQVRLAEAGKIIAPVLLALGLHVGATGAWERNPRRSVAVAEIPLPAHARRLAEFRDWSAELDRIRGGRIQPRLTVALAVSAWLSEQAMTRTAFADAVGQDPTTLALQLTGRAMIPVNDAHIYGRAMTGIDPAALAALAAAEVVDRVERAG